MRRWSAISSLVLAITILSGLATPGLGQDAPLAPGKNLPGPFHPYNVTGKRKGNFHCLVSQQALDPMVLIFTHDLAFGDPLKDLLRQIDAAIEKNPNVRLAATVVFLSEDLADVVTMDDEREKVVARIEELDKELMLKHVILTLHSKKYLAHYGLNEPKKDGAPAGNPPTLVVIYKNATVLAVHRVPDLTPEVVTTIRADVAEKVGAVRK